MNSFNYSVKNEIADLPASPMVKMLINENNLRHW